MIIQWMEWGTSGYPTFRHTQMCVPPICVIKHAAHQRSPTMDVCSWEHQIKMIINRECAIAMFDKYNKI